MGVYNRTKSVVFCFTFFPLHLLHSFELLRGREDPRVERAESQPRQQLSIALIALQRETIYYIEDGLRRKKEKC